MAEPMSWEELATRLQAEKIGLRDEVERLRETLDGRTGALRRVRRWLLAAQAQSTGGRRSTIEAHIRAVDEALRD